MKMLRVSNEMDDEEEEPDTDEVPSLNNTSASPMRYSPTPIPTSQLYELDEVIPLTEAQLVPALKLSKSGRIEVDKIIAKYNLGIQNCEYPGTLAGYVVWVHTSKFGNQLTAQPILTIFGWLDRGHSRILSNTREDIRDGSQDLMHILTVIGRKFLDAKVEPMYAAGFWMYAAPS